MRACRSDTIRSRRVSFQNTSRRSCEPRRRSRDRRRRQYPASHPRVPDDRAGWRGLPTHALAFALCRALPATGRPLPERCRRRGLPGRAAADRRPARSERRPKRLRWRAFTISRSRSISVCAAFARPWAEVMPCWRSALMTSMTASECECMYRLLNSSFEQLIWLRPPFVRCMGGDLRIFFSGRSQSREPTGSGPVGSSRHRRKR